jgi:hypothetical protein
MYHSTPARFTSSQERIALMVCKLRNANERYTRIAENIRASMKSRQYSSYRIRAAWLGLHVDIGAAIALSDTQVSKIPLPILDTTTPTPVKSRIVTHIQPSHPRPTQLPSITATAPTPLGSTSASRVDKIYSPIPPIRIPARGPLVQLDGIDWSVPGAPLLRPRELPEMSPDLCCENSSPMSLDSGNYNPDPNSFWILNNQYSSDSSGPYTPDDYIVDVGIGFPGKRKMQDMSPEDTVSHKVVLSTFLISLSTSS